MSNFQLMDHLKQTNIIQSDEKNKNASTKKNDQNLIPINHPKDGNNIKSQNIKNERKNLDNNKKEKESNINKKITEINEDNISYNINNNITVGLLNIFEDQFKYNDNNLNKEMEAINDQGILNISNVSSNSAHFSSNVSIRNDNNIDQDGEGDLLDTNQNGNSQLSLSQTKTIFIVKNG